LRGIIYLVKFPLHLFTQNQVGIQASSKQHCDLISMLILRLMDAGVGVYIGFSEDHRLRDVYPSTAQSDSRFVLFLFFFFFFFFFVMDEGLTASEDRLKSGLCT